MDHNRKRVAAHADGQISGDQRREVTDRTHVDAKPTEIGNRNPHGKYDKKDRTPSSGSQSSSSLTSSSRQRQRENKKRYSKHENEYAQQQRKVIGQSNQFYGMYSQDFVNEFNRMMDTHIDCVNIMQCTWCKKRSIYLCGCSVGCSKLDRTSVPYSASQPLCEDVQDFAEMINGNEEGTVDISSFDFVTADDYSDFGDVVFGPINKPWSNDIVSLPPARESSVVDQSVVSSVHEVIVKPEVVEPKKPFRGLERKPKWYNRIFGKEKSKMDYDLIINHKIGALMQQKNEKQKRTVLVDDRMVIPELFFYLRQKMHTSYLNREVKLAHVKNLANKWTEINEFQIIDSFDMNCWEITIQKAVDQLDSQFNLKVENQDESRFRRWIPSRNLRSSGF
jgi:hypothetical protein